MDEASVRRFGSAPGEPSTAGGYTTSLFTRIGTRSATIVAYYEHLPGVTVAPPQSEAKPPGTIKEKGALGKAIQDRRALALPGIPEEHIYHNLNTLKRK